MIRILMVSVAFDSTNLIFNPSLSFTAAAAAAIIHCCQCHNPVVVVVSSTMKRRDVSFRSVCLSFQRTTIYSTTTTAAVQTMFASYQFHRDFHSLSVDEGGGGGRYCNIYCRPRRSRILWVASNLIVCTWRASWICKSRLLSSTAPAPACRALNLLMIPQRGGKDAIKLSSSPIVMAVDGGWVVLTMCPWPFSRIPKNPSTQSVRVRFFTRFFYDVEMQRLWFNWTLKHLREFNQISRRWSEWNNDCRENLTSCNRFNRTAPHQEWGANDRLIINFHQLPLPHPSIPIPTSYLFSCW